MKDGYGSGLQVQDEEHGDLKESRKFVQNLKNSMEKHTLKNVNKCLNTNIYSCSETSCGQSSSLYLNVVHFFNTSVN